MQAIDVNYLAVLACGVASMVLGYVWYGPLFGKMWIEMMGFDKLDSSKQEAMKNSMTKSYSLTFVGSLVMAYVFSHFLIFTTSYMRTEGVSAGLSAGFWIWLGFLAPLTLGSVLWEGKSWKLWTLNNAYNLLQLLIFGVILSLWK
ncbi:MAG: hypothetical protein A2660_02580 [Candidatus Doudnabacteria bacterium RIFCSPHIGHO2_01_FULL_45_18]|uniref:DUF1761 domain-containing protein n=1 Tax=Candidatus Doudnabacteria bacterium RIFCSPHIGHO2_01_FULL_45_18 TaxID=1817823 RepID=A0A1F5NRM5_9BACT|nr:MAG: hypothetical protein A2660_02580 [Candidatus Doudnabacteria bacterium RIFCSPHIGHO2_01_FULL_45_18]